MYDVWEFNTSVFATRPGELSLGPADIRCNLLVRTQRSRRRGALFDDFFDDDFFGGFFGGYRTRPITVSSVPLEIKVLPLPEGNPRPGAKPAVGNFDLYVQASPREVKLGDPITLKMTVQGRGNFQTVSPPRLSSLKGFKTYDPQVSQGQQEKTFEQVLIPEKEIKEIPSLDFVFFNPDDGEYHILSRGPIAIKVSRPRQQQGIKIIEAPAGENRIVSREELGRDIIYIKTSLGRLRRPGRHIYNRLWFWCCQLFALLSLLIFVGWHKKTQRIKTDVEYARSLRAPKTARRGLRDVRAVLSRGGSPQEFYSCLSRSLRGYLGDKFHLPSAGITEEFVDNVLRPQGAGEEVAVKLKRLFRDCDMAKFAPAEFGAKQMKEALGLLKEAINILERKPQHGL